MGTDTAQNSAKNIIYIVKTTAVASFQKICETNISFLNKKLMPNEAMNKTKDKLFLHIDKNILLIYNINVGEKYGKRS